MLVENANLRHAKRSHFGTHHLRGVFTARVRWPEFAYLVDRQTRFIYCPIQKVACSSLMRWFLRVNGMTDPQIGKDEHELVLPYRMRNLGSWQATQLLLDRDVFSFVFVRNPWSRLVSAYLNLLTTVNDVSQPVLHSVYRERGQTSTSNEPLTADMTFAEFIAFLQRGNPRTFNVHWKPQHYFLEGNRFDFIGRFERLADDFEIVRHRLNIELTLPRSNTTQYAGALHDVGAVGDWAPARLRELPAFPDHPQFYTTELRDIVGGIYARDLRMFGYTFDSTTNE